MGEGFLLAFGLLFALHPGVLAVPRHPLGLAMAHLLLLGFGVGVLLGAVHQLVPVVLEVPLYRHRWGYPVMLLWGLGAALLVTGFAWNPALVPWGGGLALLGLSLFTTACSAPSSWPPAGTGWPRPWPGWSSTWS